MSSSLRPRRIRQLHAFTDFEICLYWYAGIGGVLSAVYFAGALVNSGFMPYLLSLQALEHPLHTLSMVSHILLGAILRTLLWFPDFFYSMVVQHQSFTDWLLGAKALNG